MLEIIFHIQSAIILMMIYYGVYHRKNRSRHVPTMIKAIIWDIILILQIEISRGAVERAVKVTSNKAILNYHVAVAITVVVLYGCLIYYGRRILRGDDSVRSIHRKLGLLTVVLRTSTLITAYMVHDTPEG